MQFTQIPADYAPLGGPLVYRFADSTPRTVDVSVYDYGIGDTVGARRLTEVASASFDAAPYLRRRPRFVPAVGATGFVDGADRAVTAALEVDGVRTPVRTFLSRTDPVTLPALLTVLPAQRLVTRGGCEELTLVTGTPCTAEVEVYGAEGGMRTERYAAPRSGLLLFRLRTDDFPEAEQLTVRFDRFAQVVYRFVRSSEEGCRVAWRSAAGSVEHYDFPVVGEERVETERTGTFDGEVPRTTRVGAVRRLTLRSAYEPTAVLRALAGIATAPQVWVVERGEYFAAEPLTDAVVLRSHGTLLNVELQLRLRMPLPWN